MPFSPPSTDREAHSPLRLGVDGDRLFLSRCLDWRRPIGGLYRAPQLGPPRVLWWFLRGGLGADLSSAAQRLAISAYDGVTGFSWYDPTQPFPGLGSDVGLVIPSRQLTLEITDPLLSLGNLRPSCRDLVSLGKVDSQGRRVRDGQDQQYDREGDSARGQAVSPAPQRGSCFLVGSSCGVRCARRGRLAYLGTGSRPAAPRTCAWAGGGPSTGRQLSGLEPWKGRGACVAGRVVEILLDPQQLVVLGHPVGTRRSAGLDLAAVGSDRKIGNRGVLGLT
jgi:hypothetical protein